MVIGALWLMVFASSSQLMILSPILPKLGKALHIPSQLQGTLVATYGLTMAFVALFIGPISDKVGRRRILLWGCGAMSFTLFLHVFAYDFTSIFIIRALAGACGGLLSGVAVAYVGDYFPYEHRGWANGWVMSGIAAGQVLGVPLGVALTGWFDYHAPFLMFAFPMMVAFVLSYFFVPQPNVTLNNAPISLGSIARNYYLLLHDRTILSAVMAYFLMFFSLMLFMVYLPTWITEHLGLDMQDIAKMMIFGGIANVLVGPQMGKLSDRIGRKSLIIASCLGMAVVMLGTVYWVTSLVTGCVAYFIAMVFVAMRMSPLQALMTAIVPAEKRGTLFSLTLGLGQIGSGIGSTLAGIMYKYMGYESNTMLSAFFILMMALVVWRYLPEPPIHEEMAIA